MKKSLATVAVVILCACAGFASANADKAIEKKIDAAIEECEKAKSPFVVRMAASKEEARAGIKSLEDKRSVLGLRSWRVLRSEDADQWLVVHSGEFELRIRAAGQYTDVSISPRHAHLGLMSNKYVARDGYRQIARAILNTTPQLRGELLIADETQQASARSSATPVLEIPEVIAPAEVSVNSDARAVKEMLIRAHAKNLWAMTGESEHQVTFAQAVAANNRLLGHLLVGNYAIDSYRMTVQYTFTSPNEKATQVDAFIQAEVQDGFGRITSYNITSNERARSVVQRLLEDVKLKAEVNTASVASASSAAISHP